MKFKFDEEDIRRIRLEAMKEIYNFSQESLKEFLERLRNLEFEDLK